MLNPISTELFNEFVSKRCEEILFKDEAYQGLNDAILVKENIFKKTLTSKQIMQYNKIEEEIINSISYAIQTVYINCLHDIKSLCSKS